MSNPATPPLLELARRHESGAPSQRLWGIVIRSGSADPTAPSHYSSALPRRGARARWPRAAGRPAHGLRGRSSFRRALDRIAEAIPPERLLVVLLRREVAELTPELETFGGRHIVQPAWRGSAAEAFLATLRIAREDPHATLALLPREHLAGDGPTIMRYVSRAARAVDLRPDVAVMIGAPHHAAMATAWIEPGGPVERLETLGIRAVARFVPHATPAERAALIESGAFAATRVIVGRVSTLVAAGRAQLPEVLETLEPLEDAATSHERDLLCEAVYECMPRADLVSTVPPRGEGFAVLPIPEFLELPARDPLAS